MLAYNSLVVENNRTEKVPLWLKLGSKIAVAHEYKQENNTPNHLLPAVYMFECAALIPSVRLR